MISKGNVNGECKRKFSLGKSSLSLGMEVHLVLWWVVAVAFVKQRGVRQFGSDFVVAFLNHIGR